MSRSNCVYHRRKFLGITAALATGAAWWEMPGWAEPLTPPAVPLPASALAQAKVAIVPCTTYAAAAVKAALEKSFALLGGLGNLVRNKTVTVKINLTGTNFLNFLGRPVGETYMTHYATALGLSAVLFANGARRVLFVESTNSKSSLETSLDLANWDLKALKALGQVEFENTRNLGLGKRYSTLKVGGGGYLFSSFDLNHAYEDTDVLISLAKLKNHLTAGVTLTMKNLFGITPNSLYGDEAGTEDAVAGRGSLHGPAYLQAAREVKQIKLPGMKVKYTDPPGDHGYRVPHTVADLCAARPIDLAIIDGITSVDGGEGPWCESASPMHFTTPGVIIAGLNPVSTDAVGTAIMGYNNPRASRGTPPFELCDNHLLLAEKAGTGCADLKQIEILGQALEKSICPYKFKMPR